MQSELCADAVAAALHGNLCVLTIRNAPVNALSVAVRRGLLAAIEAAEANPAVHAVVLVGAGQHFIGGADIREFGKPPQAPALPDLCNRIEACNKPVIAAMHGVALGGGLEIALAAHYRVADAGARFGLPEVQLGLMPGAGGTQRAPRLLGAAAALDLMLSGRQVNAPQALHLGLIDQIGHSDDILAEGLRYAQEVVRAQAPVRRTRDARGLGDRAGSQAAIDAAQDQIRKNSALLFSPQKIVDAVQDALNLPMDEGLRLERQRFLACIDSPQRAGLIHAFFAEREVWKVPQTQAVAPRAITRVGVVGGGAMGAGIAVAMLDAGWSVTLVEPDEATLARARADMEKICDERVAKGLLTASARAAVMQRWTGGTTCEALSGADLVLEAVPEDMAVKQAVFAALDRVCKPGAILATTTSCLDINALAAGVSRPADVIGLHFYAPAHSRPLLEVVVPHGTHADVVASAFHLAKTLHKVPVRTGVGDGYVGHRVMAVYRKAVEHLLEQGVSPEQIDRAVRAFGFSLGPWPVVALAAGRQPPTCSDEDIVRRVVAALANEGAQLVAEGMALRPLDIDVVLMNGFDFPRHRGGPMHCADSLGLDRVLAEICKLAYEAPLLWHAAPLLEDLVARKASFASLNRLA